jgi:hypothetical protein
MRIIDKYIFQNNEHNKLASTNTRLFYCDFGWVPRSTFTCEATSDEASNIHMPVTSMEDLSFNWSTSKL